MYFRVWRGSGQGRRVNVSCIFLHLRHEDDATLVYEYDVDLCRTTGHQQLAAKRQWSCRLSWPCRRVSWQKKCSILQEGSRLSLLLEQNKHIKHAAYANEIARPFPAPETNQIQSITIVLPSNRITDSRISTQNAGEKIR